MQSCLVDGLKLKLTTEKTTIWTKVDQHAKDTQTSLTTEPPREVRRWRTEDYVEMRVRTTPQGWCQDHTTSPYKAGNEMSLEDLIIKGTVAFQACVVPLCWYTRLTDKTLGIIGADCNPQKLTGTLQTIHSDFIMYFTCIIHVLIIIYFFNEW